MTKIRRIESEAAFKHYAYRSLTAIASMQKSYGSAWPWRDAIAALVTVLSAEDPRLAAYCTTATDAALPCRSADEPQMDCMEFCSRRVLELMALQALENLGDAPKECRGKSPFDPVSPPTTIS